jgi:hypothetical protein
VVGKLATVTWTPTVVDAEDDLLGVRVGLCVAGQTTAAGARLAQSQNRDAQNGRPHEPRAGVVV